MAALLASAGAATAQDAGRSNFEAGQQAYFQFEYDKAVQLFRLAAEQGNVDAMLKLGHMYTFSDMHFLPTISGEPYRWYRMAADRGNAEGQYAVAWIYQHNNGAEAVRFYRLAADQGHNAAMSSLGYLYETGRTDLPINHAEAARWYRMAVDRNQDANSWEALKRLYACGRSNPQVYAEGLQWYRSLADQGDPRAQTILGGYYEQGGPAPCLPRDDTQAVRWYRMAAEQGEYVAKYRLSHMYLNGLGVPQNAAEALMWCDLALQQEPLIHWDYPEEVRCDEHRDKLTEAQKAEAGRKLLSFTYSGATSAQDAYERGARAEERAQKSSNESHLAFRWFRTAAVQGHVLGQYRLGRMHEWSGLTGAYDEAARWYRMAAEQGNVDAQYSLGDMYLRGRGADFPQNAAEAVRWFRLAADQGDADAQNDLGDLYAKGLGVQQNDVEAVRWFQLAANNGLAGAQKHLADMYAGGRGLVRNDAEAAKWYRLAADQDYGPAQFRLGLMYADGRGVSQNFVEAYKWVELSKWSYEYDGTTHERLRDQMTPAQIAEGKRLATERAAQRERP